MIKRLKYLRQKITRSTIAKESGSMYIAEGLGMLFAFLITVTRAKFLSVDEVGLISYIVALIAVTSAFFNFGLDNTAARVLLNEKGVESKESVFGTSFVVSFILAEFYGIILIFINLTVPFWGRTDIQYYVYCILPFAGYNILLVTYKQLCFASGKIKEASIQLCSSYIIYWLFLIIAHLFNFLTITVALVSSYVINMLSVIIPAVFYHKDSLKIDKTVLRNLNIEQKERGWKIYLSRVFFSSTFNIDTLILGIFHPLDSVAHYAIAKYLSIPVQMIGNSVSQATYRQYANINKVNSKLIKNVLKITVFAAILMYIVGRITVLFLGNDYVGIIIILPISILYSVVNGVNSLYNSFMNAKGMADELKKLAFMGALANILLNFALIIPFGAIGGVIASLLVVIIILALRIYYCSKYEETQPQ